MKRGALIFSGVQAAGLVCMWTWAHAPGAEQSFLWGSALVFLFPGNILSGFMVCRDPIRSVHSAWFETVTVRQ